MMAECLSLHAGRMGIFDSMTLTRDRAQLVGRSLPDWVLSRSSDTQVCEVTLCQARPGGGPGRDWKRAGPVHHRVRGYASSCPSWRFDCTPIHCPRAWLKSTPRLHDRVFWAKLPE